MSLITLSFNLSAISKDALPLFLAHVAKIQMSYEDLCRGVAPLAEPHPEAPPAESLPVPPFPEEAVEQTLEEMTNQELRDRLADLTGKPRGRKTTPKFPTKAALIEEIKRLEGMASLPRLVEERDGSLFVSVMSQDSLEKPEPAADATSETGSKKPRKSRFANLSPEEADAKKAEIAARLKAGREAARAKKAAQKAFDAGLLDDEPLGASAEEIEAAAAMVAARAAGSGSA